MTDVGLCENIPKTLQPKQKELYESLIRSCDSDDPLGDWYEYLKWVEENYWNNAGEYGELLQRCLVRFKNEIRYYQDTRYVDLWLKHIKISKRPYELFKKCLAKGIGNRNALMYITWSHDLEISNDLKGAHCVLVEALNCKAQPKDFLLKAQQDLLIRIGRSLIGDIDINHVKAEQKNILDELRLYDSKRNMGNKANHSSGVLQSKTVNTNLQNDVFATPDVVFKVPDKENTSIDSTSKPNKQQLHRKLQARYICDPYQTKSKEVENFDCPLAVFDRDDATKRVMYCKSKVYTEFSFEELRAIAYFKGYRAPRHKRDEDEIQSEKCHVENVQEGYNDMEIARQELNTPNCPEAKVKPPRPTTRYIFTNKVYSNGTEYCFEELRTIEYMKENMQKKCNKFSNEKLTEVETVPSNQVAHKFDVIDKPALLPEESNIALYDTDSKDKDCAQSSENQDLGSLSALYSNSMTCHTREAFKVTQEFWSSTDEHQNLRNSVNVDNKLPNNGLKPPGSVKKNFPFEVFEDKTAHHKPLDSMKKSVPFEIFEDETAHLKPLDSVKKIAPFEVFQEETDSLKPPNSKKTVMPFEIFEDETGQLIGHKNDVQPIKQPLPFPVLNNEEAKKVITSNSDQLLHDHNESKDEKNAFGIDGVEPMQDENYIYLLKHLIGNDNQDSKPAENVGTSDGFFQGIKAHGNDDVDYLPYVPSPGCTEEDENALKGTETKENDPPEDFIPPSPEKRVMKGVLQPNDTFPCVPLSDPVLEEDDSGDKDYTSCTSAFCYPLVSSTPFTNHMKPVISSTESDAQEEENHLHLKTNVAAAAACVNPVSNLSKIVESTHEYLRISSEGSVATSSNSCSVENSGTRTLTTLAKQNTVTPSRSHSESRENSNSLRLMHVNSQRNILSQDRLVEQDCIKYEDVTNIREDRKRVQEHKTEKLTNKNSVHSVNSSKELDFIQKKNLPYCNDIQTDVDPFDVHVIQRLLNDVEFSSSVSPDRLRIQNLPIPQFRIHKTLSLGCDTLRIDEVLGEGNYAKVYKGVDLESKKYVAVKVQKPSWMWEFYICEQIRKRLNDPMKGLAFMNIQRAHIFNDGSVMVTDYAAMGNLLSLINITKQLRMSFPEELLLRCMVELLNIAEMLQSCKIIHGDIKPDNLIVRMIPNLSSTEPSLQLIDMGRGIDMTLFPQNTTFTKVVSTQGFQCVEMQSNRPWTYQIDLYGIAGSMHCAIFLEYMKVRKNDRSRWLIQHLIPRYNKLKSVWQQFFDTILNVESCDKMPDFLDLKQLAAKELMQRKPDSCVKFFEMLHLKK